MSLSALVEKMKEEVAKQRQQEKEVLQEIAAVTSPEFAEQAADVLNSRKHPYSFEAYLILLERLQRLVIEDVPNCLALDMVQTGETAETLINAWRLANTGDE